MLSDGTLRKMGELDRALTERRVRSIYEMWSRADVEGILAATAPNVKLATTGQWTGAAPPSIGREALGAFLRRHHLELEKIVSVLHEIVIDGDRVVVHRTAVGRWRASGQRYQCDFIDFFRFRDGLVVEFSEYADPAWIDAEAQVRT